MKHAVLPAKDALLLACRVEPRDDHPLLRGIHLLAGLHERRLREEVDATHFHAGRQTLALAIDHWVAAELPVPRGGARMHTETLGSVLDRLAEHCALAHAALSSAPKGQVHEAWELLAELALGYQDLAIDLTAGSRRLPAIPGARTRSNRADASSTNIECLFSRQRRPVSLAEAGRSASKLALSA
ncbi:DUF4254 domain-containing protein [Nocardia sp. NPDC057227]|uniref:DUF4254 domain-containing protein n=1 Tax=Nocardia sp. NPDC057227 TaxID=3346056 RepID=UPI0036403468